MCVKKIEPGGLTDEMKKIIDNIDPEKLTSLCSTCSGSREIVVYALRRLYKEKNEDAFEAIRGVHDYYVKKGSNFSSQLVWLICKADPGRKVRIAQGFPLFVMALAVCDSMSLEDFCSEFKDAI